MYFVLVKQPNENAIIKQMIQENISSIKHPWYVQYAYNILRKLFGPLVRLIWIRNVSGLQNIPRNGPAIITFNHQSYFDFLCFIAVCPRQIHFLSAEKFFSHKIWKHIMKFTAQIKVYRHEHDKHILHATVHSHLEAGKLIGIFPEGTRAPDPIEMLHAFTGVAKYAVAGKVPVIPVGIRGSYEVMSRHVSRPTLTKIISIHIGEPVHFTEHHGKTLSEKEHRDLTDKIMFEISKLSGKKYSHYGKLERTLVRNTKI